METDTKETNPFNNNTIPYDWEIKKLANIGKIRMCKRVFNHETTDKGVIPFFKIGTFGKEADAFISKELYDNYRKRFSFPKKGDILISAAGTLGRTVVYDGSPAYFQDSNIVWIDNDETTLTNQYLYFVYQIVKYESEGGTIQRLYNSIISNVKFLCPPLPEQRAIAHILGLMDNMINKNDQLIVQKELRKKWLMQNLLTGKKRLMGFDGKWKEIVLGDLGCFFKGAGVAKSEIKKTGLPAIRYGELYTTHHNIINSISTFIDEKSANLSKEISKGDILFAGSGETLEDIGKCATFTLNEKAFAGGDIIVFRPKNNDSLFMGYLLNFGYVNAQKVSMGKGHSVVHIYPKDLAVISIQIPSIEEQTAIAQVLQAVDKEIELLKTKAAKLREQKKWMMQVLLTGKKRVKL